MTPNPATTAALPQHPTLTHPVTGQPITAIGRRRDGRLIWPAIGGSQPVGGEPAPIPVLGAPPAQPPAPQPPQPAPGGQPTLPSAVVPGPPPGGDHGYPPHTPVESMTPPQQINFWRHHARRNQDQLRQYADYEQLKAERDQLRAATQTDLERAQTTARQEGEATGRRESGRQVVEAYFTAATAGRLTREQVSAAVAGLNIDHFMANGAVDPQRVFDHANLTVGYAQPTAAGYPPQPVAGAPGQPAPGAPYGQQVAPPSPYGSYQPVMPPAAPTPVAPGYGQPPAPGYPPTAGQVPVQPAYGYLGQQGHLWPDPYGATVRQTPLAVTDPYAQATGQQRQVPDYGQGPSAASPQNGLAAGAARAAERHGRTRSQQIGGARQG